MASSYSSLLRLEKMANGEFDDGWGTQLNNVLEMIEDSVSGRAAVTHDDTANYTLTTANGTVDEARNMILNIGGTLTAARNVVCPTSAKLYVIKNATTGGYAITLKTTAGTGISVANGKTMLLMCDGTNVVDAIDAITFLGTMATQAASAVAITGGTISGVPITQNSQSAAYTTVLTDAGKHILHPSADTTARTFTIDSNANVAYATGTAITFVNQASAGVLTIAITSDTMRLAGAGTTGSRTLAANGIATALKLSATEWIISGTGLS